MHRIELAREKNFEMDLVLMTLFTPYATSVSESLQHLRHLTLMDEVSCIMHRLVHVTFKLFKTKANVTKQGVCSCAQIQSSHLNFAKMPHC